MSKTNKGLWYICIIDETPLPIPCLREVHLWLPGGVQHRETTTDERWNCLAANNNTGKWWQMNIVIDENEHRWMSKQSSQVAEKYMKMPPSSERWNSDCLVVKKTRKWRQTNVKIVSGRAKRTRKSHRQINVQIVNIGWWSKNTVKWQQTLER